MQTREVPDFWRLHTNKNCAFPLSKRFGEKYKQTELALIFVEKQYFS